MTIDEAIKHCLEVAEENEELSSKFDEWDDWEKADADNCRSCAADHRQLAEWLTELKHLRDEVHRMKPDLDDKNRALKEVKRLLKLAVTDMNNGSCIANCYKCKHKENCDYSQRFEWERTDEVDKLIGGSENDT